MCGSINRARHPLPRWHNQGREGGSHKPNTMVHARSRRASRRPDLRALRVGVRPRVRNLESAKPGDAYHVIMAAVQESCNHARRIRHADTHACTHYPPRMGARDAWPLATAALESAQGRLSSEYHSAMAGSSSMRWIHAITAGAWSRMFAGTWSALPS